MVKKIPTGVASILPARLAHLDMFCFCKVFVTPKHVPNEIEPRAQVGGQTLLCFVQKNRNIQLGRTTYKLGQRRGNLENTKKIKQDTEQI